MAMDILPDQHISLGLSPPVRREHNSVVERLAENGRLVGLAGRLGAVPLGFGLEEVHGLV